MIGTYDLETLPDVDAYVSGLKAIEWRMKLEHFRVLQAQYSAPAHTATATELARSAGITGGHAVVNRMYGGLGHMFCVATGFVPEIRPDDSARWWAVWSVGHSTRDRGFLWEMRPQVVEALQRLGWVNSAPVPEEVFRKQEEERTAQSLRSATGKRLARLASAPAHAPEVRVLRVEFQRNPDVVASVLLAADGRCDLCGDEAPFKRTDGSPYLEVHHVTPLSDRGEDTLRNAVALCPNCHREAHHGQHKGRHNNRLQHIAESRAALLLLASAKA